MIVKVDQTARRSAGQQTAPADSPLGFEPAAKSKTGVASGTSKPDSESSERTQQEQR